MSDRPRCAIGAGPGASTVADAVVAGGGEVVAPAEAQALVWLDPRDPQGLTDTLAAHPALEWVQLPWAGIEPYVDVLDDKRIWTCGKGVYARPVAEHALALALAGMRGVAHYARQRSWSPPRGRNLVGARVTVLGGGGIAQELLALLRPFDARVTVVRRHPAAMDGAEEVVGQQQLHDALADSDLVVVALALTPQTRGIIDAAALAAMPAHAWLVNVARGAHVDTDALVAALRAGRLGGAALDVTDPEPLPDDHPLWSLENAIITPHVGNTPEMGLALLAERIEQNVARWAAGEPLLGPVDVDLGY